MSLEYSSSSDVDESSPESEVLKEKEAVVSLLDRLKAPTPADIARPRKIQKNDPPKGQRRSKGPSSSDPKGITPSQRVREFDKEALTVSHGHLFCTACREQLSLKRCVIKNHIRSKKHESSKKRLEKKEARERNIADSLTKYNTEVHPRGETLPQEQQVYRVKVVSAFMKAGVPLNKIESFRDLLEENALRLTDRRNMHDYIPFIHGEEEKLIRSEIEGQNVAVVFDGTSRLGEALAIIVRYISPDWRIEQRLLRVQMLSKSLADEEIARELISVLSVNFGIRSANLLASMRDRVAANNVAMQTLKVVYPTVVDVGCFSHTIDHVGEKFDCPVLNEFMTFWISLFSHSPKTRMLWRCRTGQSMSSYSKTRWWSKWEVVKQVMLYFGDVEPFLLENDDVGPALRPKLLALFAVPHTKSQLQIEMAATVDWGEPFVKACYVLEGDGPLALQCYEVIESVKQSLRTENIPNVRALSEKLTKQPRSHPLHEQWVDYARDCVKGGIDYFNMQLSNSLKVPLEIFKACRLFSPQKVVTMSPTASSLDQSLSKVPFISEAEIEDLKKELPDYLARAADVSEEFDPLDWWKRNSSTLPHWSACAKKILLIQPSSAAAERVFSLLKASFGDQQESCLQDYVQTSLMLQYNKR